MPRGILQYQTGDGSGPLSRLLNDGGLRPVFQPIVGMVDGAIKAHEALIRGPSGLPQHAPDRLIAAARRENLLIDFEVACLDVQLHRWAALRPVGRLFLNVSASTLVEIVERHTASSIALTVGALGMRPSSLVFEITEHEHVADIDRLQHSVQKLHAAGLALALDDFGDGRSSLRLWSELKPDFVKVDKYFTRELSRHGHKVQTLRALLQIAEVFGTSLVAEGIENDDDLRAVRDLCISLGQGYRLGRPNSEPIAELADDVLSVIRARQISVLPQVATASSPRRLRELSVLDVVPVAPDSSNDEVAALFHANPSWHAIAVVERDTPVGLIGRNQFMEQYSKPFFRELFGRKSCMQFANMSPRLIERDQTIGELLSVLTSQDQRYLSEGFIVTDQGRYLGLGTSEQLVRNVTESRIEAARHANPLTFLPGNIPISEHIGRLLGNAADFVACYADLSNFKPFNDYYGYWLGDEVIRLQARVVTQYADDSRDFVGHVGGDDFVVLFQSGDWEARCRRMIDEFDRAVQELYDPAAREAGGIEAEDRHGVSRFFPFTSLYIGAVPARGGEFSTAEQVASAAARARQVAKRAGMSFAVGSGLPGESGFAQLRAL